MLLWCIRAQVQTVGSCIGSLSGLLRLAWLASSSYACFWSYCRCCDCRGFIWKLDSRCTFTANVVSVSCKPQQHVHPLLLPIVTQPSQKWIDISYAITRDATLCWSFPHCFRPDQSSSRSCRYSSTKGQVVICCFYSFAFELSSRVDSLKPI